jgi:hypothetical protein
MLSFGHAHSPVVVVDATTVYWVTASQLLSVPIGGGSETALAASDYPWDLAVDDRDVYWTTTGGVAKVPKTGGDKVVLSTEDNASDVAVDDTSIYWTVGNDPDGKVLKLPK